MGVGPVVSVVIPSFRSERHIATCLAALAKQAPDTPPFEVVLVDSSDDGTAHLVESRFPHVRLIRSETRLSAGAARNLGAQQARAQVVLFTDTDCTPGPQWVSSLHEALMESGALLAGGAMINGTPGSATGSVGFYLEFFRFLGHRGGIRRDCFLVSANLGLSREALSQYRFSDESLGEDMRLSWQVAHDHPGMVLFVPAAKVSHLNRIGVRTLFTYQRQIGRAAVRYRMQTGGAWLRTLRRFPVLCLGIPILMLPWVAVEIARRGSLPDLARYICLLPLALAANLCWLRGFYEELVKD